MEVDCLPKVEILIKKSKDTDRKNLIYFLFFIFVCSENGDLLSELEEGLEELCCCKETSVRRSGSYTSSTKRH